MNEKLLDRDQILSSIPHDNPFVFVDEAKLVENGIEGAYTITGDEFFLPGHFPGRPVFPASIMLEALGQLAIVYLYQTYHEEGLDLESVYFLGSEDTQCRRKCYPGERLDMKIEAKIAREPMFIVRGRIEVGDEMAVRVSALKLSYSLGGAVS